MPTWRRPAPGTARRSARRPSPPRSQCPTPPRSPCPTPPRGPCPTLPRGPCPTPPRGPRPTPLTARGECRLPAPDPRDAQAILQSLQAGVVPRRGLQHLAVGRVAEVRQALAELEALR